MANGNSMKEATKWIVGDLNSLVKQNDSSYENSKVTPEKLLELVKLLQDAKISGKMAKDILRKVFESGKSPSDIVKESGGEQVSDTSSLQPVIDKILEANPDVVEKVKGGKTKSADFLMGQVMRETKGRAKPDLVRQMILDSIKEK